MSGELGVDARTSRYSAAMVAQVMESAHQVMNSEKRVKRMIEALGSGMTGGTGGAAHHPNVYCALEYGITPELDDCSDALTSLLRSIPHDSKVVFPRGVYKFRKQIVLPRVVTIEGEQGFASASVNTWDTGGTIFQVDASALAGKAFIDFFTSANCRRAAIRNISFIADAYQLAEDREMVRSDPARVFTETVRVAGVDCLYLGYNCLVCDCGFFGFSGAAITGGTGGMNNTAWNTVRGCYFEQCAVAINTTIDSQYSDLRINQAGTGIVVNGTANLLSNIRMDSIMRHGFLFNRHSHGNSLTGFDIDFCGCAAIALRGRKNYIAGTVGRCAVYSVGKTKETLDYGSELDRCSTVFLNDAGDEFTEYNRIDIITDYGSVMDEGKDEYLAPVFPLSVSQGSYVGNDINIVGPYSRMESHARINAMDDIIAAPQSAPFAFYKGTLRLNGDVYAVFSKTSLPIDPNAVYVNGFLEGYSRDPATWLPERAGLMMNRFWQDEAYFSIYNPTAGRFEWRRIGAVSAAAGENALDSFILDSTTLD